MNGCANTRTVADGAFARAIDIHAGHSGEYNGDTRSTGIVYVSTRDTPLV
jgi:hypothetical protein